MSFNDFLNSAWNDHATRAAQVATRFNEGIRLLEKNDQISSLANLITHVMGEHLGQWEKGVQLLQQLEKLSFYDPLTESKNTIKRSVSILELASGKLEVPIDLSVSDQIRVLVVAASALNEQKNSDKALKLFQRALDQAQSGMSKEDPANRVLAISGNNIACSLEERESLTNDETNLMILAAHTGRNYWEIAGSWLEIERAEYRLSKSFLKTKNYSRR